MRLVASSVSGPASPETQRRLPAVQGQPCLYYQKSSAGEECTRGIEIREEGTEIMRRATTMASRAPWHTAAEFSGERKRQTHR